MIPHVFSAYLAIACLACADDARIPLDVLGITADSTIQVNGQPATISDGLLAMPLGESTVISIMKNGKTNKLPPITAVNQTTASAEPTWSLDEPVTAADGSVAVVGFYQSSSLLRMTQIRAELNARQSAMLLTHMTNTTATASVTVPSGSSDAAPGNSAVMISSAETTTRVSSDMKTISQESVYTICADGASAPALRARTTDKPRARLSDSQNPIAGRPLIRCWVRLRVKAAESPTKQDDAAEEARRREADREFNKLDELIDQQMDKK